MSKKQSALRAKLARAFWAESGLSVRDVPMRKSEAIRECLDRLTDLATEEIERRKDFVRIMDDPHEIQRVVRAKVGYDD